MTCAGDRHKVEVHDLKVWPDQFSQLGRTKHYELRENDRDYHTGDILILREWSPADVGGEYSGNLVIAAVTNIVSAKSPMMATDQPLQGVLTEGWVLMSIKVIGEHRA